MKLPSTAILHLTMVLFLVIKVHPLPKAMPEHMMPNDDEDKFEDMIDEKPSSAEMSVEEPNGSMMGEEMSKEDMDNNMSKENMNSKENSSMEEKEMDMSQTTEKMNTEQDFDSSTMMENMTETNNMSMDSAESTINEKFMEGMEQKAQDNVTADDSSMPEKSMMEQMKADKTMLCPEKPNIVRNAIMECQKELKSSKTDMMGQPDTEMKNVKNASDGISWEISTDDMKGEKSMTEEEKMKDGKSMMEDTKMNSTMMEMEGPTPCCYQCILKQLEMLDDMNEPEQTMAEKWIKEYVEDEKEKMMMLKKLPECFKKMKMSSMDSMSESKAKKDGKNKSDDVKEEMEKEDKMKCEFSKNLVMCLTEDMQCSVLKLH